MNNVKVCKSKYYNYLFNLNDGFFIRWGRYENDDPKFSPFGPELIDIEVSTMCGLNCSACYKGNSHIGKNMSFETYKTIIDKIPENVLQIAIGVGDINANPDLKRILEYTREKGIIPNITINGYNLTEDHISFLSKNCGAIAVSHYHDGNACMNAVKRLYETLENKDTTLKQINIHKLLSKETVNECFSLLDKIKEEEVPVNAVVFLLLKPKGPRNKLTPIDDYTIYKRLLEKSDEVKAGIGMDSCSAPLVFKNLDEKDSMKLAIEPCESGLFSLYVNVDGIISPCSFCEGTEHDLKINMLEIKDFMKDVWFSTSMREWRRKLLSSTKSCDCVHKKQCRACPVFEITPCIKENIK